MTKKSYFKPSMANFAITPNTLMAASPNVNEDGSEVVMPGGGGEEEGDLWGEAVAKPSEFME